MYKSLSEISDDSSLKDAPVYEVLCKRPNPGNPRYVLLFFWCKHCERLHQHGSARINHEEYMPRKGHCNSGGVVPPPPSFYILHHVPWERTHTQNGITAPVLDVVGWTKSGKAKVICPECLKKHLHDIEKNVEYTLVKGRCHPLCFIKQEVQHEEVSFL